MFHVGQLVICVDDKPRDQKRFSPELDGLRAGTVYTIRSIGPFTNNYKETWLGVWLVEIVRPIEPRYQEYGEVPYRPDRFRPVDPQRLSIFRKALSPIRDKERA